MCGKQASKYRCPKDRIIPKLVTDITKYPYPSEFQYSETYIWNNIQKCPKGLKRPFLEMKFPVTKSVSYLENEVTYMWLREKIWKSVGNVQSAFQVNQCFWMFPLRYWEYSIPTEISAEGGTTLTKYWMKSCFKDIPCECLWRSFEKAWKWTVIVAIVKSHIHILIIFLVNLIKIWNILLILME